MQALAQEFVCVADECWDLCPPDWFNRQWLKTIKSTELFERFLKKTPDGLIPAGSSTCQGTYCMTGEGDYLGGAFAWVDRDRTLALMRSSLKKFRASPAAKMQPVPKNTLPLFIGPVPKEGGLKLQLAYRDLPRGAERFPKTQRLTRPVNLGFLDLSPEEVREFLPPDTSKKEVPLTLVKRLSQEALKDCARGQCNAGKKSFQSGQWFVQEKRRKGTTRIIELRGNSHLEGGGVTYTPSLYGLLEYDESQKQFTSFDLVATGQRRGAAQFNFRGGDEAAAPLGVAFRLFTEAQE